MIDNVDIIYYIISFVAFLLSRHCFLCGVCGIEFSILTL